MTPLNKKLLTKIRVNVCIVMIGLALSGITAFPLETELGWLVNHTGALPLAMQNWLNTIYHTLVYTQPASPVFKLRHRLAGLCAYYAGCVIYRAAGTSCEKCMDTAIWHHRLCSYISAGFYCGVYQGHTIFLAAY
jgi:hypothetical protein